jgi:Uma2 family endonuclease
MEVPQPQLVSEAEFLSLPETVERIELIDGEVIVSPSPSYWHQEVLRRIVYQLGAWASNRSSVTIGQAPLDVRFGSGRILQPDAFVLMERIPSGHEGPITATPALCIEVLSANRAYDRLTKRLIYGEAGVKEYWIVDPPRCVERWTGPQLGQVEELVDRLTSPLLPGFELAIATLFELGR